MNGKIVALSVLLVVISTGTAFQLGNMYSSRGTETAGKVSIRVISVQPGENQVLIDENINFSRRTTVFEVLDQVADVGYKEYVGVGKFVTSIDNVKQTSDKWWIYQVNGVYPNIAADRYVIANGDNIIWKFTSEWPTF